MPNSIDLYKEIFLHVIPVRIIVPWCFLRDAMLSQWLPDVGFFYSPVILTGRHATPLITR